MHCCKCFLMVCTLCIVIIMCFSSMAEAGVTLGIDINGRSAGSQVNVTKSGAAAIGSVGDVWNGYSLDGATFGNPLDPAQSDFLLDVSGNATNVKFDLSLVGADAPILNIDDMGDDLAFVQGADLTPAFPTSATLTLSGLEPGDVYDMYLYATQNTGVYASTFTIGEQSASTVQASAFTGTWRPGVDYVKLSGVSVAQDGTIQCLFEGANPASYATFSGLQMTTAPPVVELGGTPVNIDINGRSDAEQVNVTKSGAAAVGAVGDVWNGYSIDASAVSLPAIDPAQSDFLVDADGNATTIKFDLTMVGADAPAALQTSGDDMGSDLAFVEGPDAQTGFPVGATFTLSGLEAGKDYDLYLYAAAASGDYVSTFTIGDTSLSTSLGSVFAGTWIEGSNYVKFSNVVAAGDGTIECALDSGNPASYGMFSGLQIVPSVPEPSLLVMLAAVAMSVLFLRRK